MQKITFTFSGGMAANHELNFYEAGRFQYGAARFVYTLEKFRQEGRIVSRLTSKVKADIRVRASQPSSFVQEIIIFSAPIVAQCAVSVPFDALFAYIWDLLTPSSSKKAHDVAVELAKQQVQLEAEKSEQERQRTEQMRIVAGSNTASNSQIIAILSDAVQQHRSLIAEELSVTPEEMANLLEEVLAQQQRAELIRRHSDGLQAISPETERRLVGQMRRGVPDMTVPLRSSANVLSVGTPRSANSYAQLARDAAERISQESEDVTPTMLAGNIKMYDVETGYGRFRYAEVARPLAFRVPGGLKNEFRDRILEAMKEEEVRASFYIIRDMFGNPTGLVLNDILDEEWAE
jgi:hypothetical protein